MQGSENGRVVTIVYILSYFFGFKKRLLEMGRSQIPIHDLSYLSWILNLAVTFYNLLFIANKIPTVTGTLRINATVNQSVNLSVVATDADNESVTIFFIGSITGQTTNQQNASLTQTFTPDQLTNYDIRYSILYLYFLK